MWGVSHENKTDMTYEEHVAFCREVVRAADGGKFDEKVLRLKNWYRMVRRRKAGGAGKRASQRRKGF